MSGRVRSTMTSRNKVIADVAVDADPRSIQKIILLGEWAKMSVNTGDDINVLLPRDHSGTVTVTDDSMCLVVPNPDRIVTVTEIASAIACRRRGGLSALLRTPGVTETYAQFRGKVIHECIEELLRSAEGEEVNIRALKRTAIKRSTAGVKSVTKIGWEATLRQDWSTLEPKIIHLVSR